MFTNLSPDLARARVADLHRTTPLLASSAVPASQAPANQLRERSGWLLIRMGLRLVEPRVHLAAAHR